MAHVYPGDPDLGFTRDLIDALTPQIDILELGIPYADPLADGRVFQVACQRALAQGVTPAQVLTLASELRRDGFGKPIVLTTYYNIIHRRGAAAFCTEASARGIEALIVPDLPWEEADRLHAEAARRDLHLINLVAPTTGEERLQRICETASGFLYVVAVTGVTGTAQQAGEGLDGLIRRIRKFSDLPLLVGFGISSPTQIDQLPPVEGIIIGSAICRLFHNDEPRDSHLRAIHSFAGEIKQACSGSKD